MAGGSALGPVGSGTNRESSGRMPSGVSGRKIAFLATDGVEQRDLREPWDALANAGAVLHLISIHPGEIQAVRGEERVDRFNVDRLLGAVRAGDYDGLILPGGPANADRLRVDAGAKSFVRAFMDADKPVGAIGAGLRILLEDDLVRGRSIASSPILEREVSAGGGLSTSGPVEVDQRLITSRGAEDLPAFCRKLVNLFTTAIDERRLDQVVEQSFPASDPPPGPGAGR
jgi:deglycase